MVSDQWSSVTTFRKSISISVWTEQKLNYYSKKTKTIGHKACLELSSSHSLASNTRWLVGLVNTEIESNFYEIHLVKFRQRYVHIDRSSCIMKTKESTEKWKCLIWKLSLINSQHFLNFYRKLCATSTNNIWHERVSNFRNMSNGARCIRRTETTTTTKQEWIQMKRCSVKM